VRRPDFLDGLGIVVGPAEVALAAVSKRLIQVRLRGTRVFPLPGSEQATERRQALVAAVREFLGAHEIDPGNSVLCIPRSEAAITRVLLPKAAQENLGQVLEYEMENLVPLPREEIHFDYVVRPLGEERIEVLLVCVPREVVRGYLEALEEAGVRPRSIAFPSTALADYVTFCRGSVAPGLGLLVEGPEATEIALFADGRLVSSQLVAGTPGKDAALAQRSLARQLADALLEPEKTTLHRWSVGRDASAPPAPADEDDLVALARGKLATDDAFFTAPDPSVLAAVGAALGAVREGVVRVNLLPQENRQAFDEGPSIATWVLMAASLVLLIAWGASAMVKDVMLRRQVQSRLEEVAPDVREVKTIQNEIDELQRQVEILGSAGDGRITTLLKDLTELIPADSYLTTLNVRSGRLTLDGQARSASDIITALEKSKRFKNVTFSSPTTQQGDKQRFALTAEVLK
jgi:general secretion pathway protein L